MVLLLLLAGFAVAAVIDFHSAVVAGFDDVVHFEPDCSGSVPLSHEEASDVSLHIPDVRSIPCTLNLPYVGNLSPYGLPENI